MYSMPGSWAEGQIRRLIGPDEEHPLATTHRHVAWENPALRLECNLVRHVASSEDSFAVRLVPAVDPYYASVVIPRAPDGRLYLVGRYRYAIDRWSIEFPRFDFDSSDAGWRDAAAADLRRATGLTARRLGLLGAIQTDPAILSASTVVVLAQGCTRALRKSTTRDSAEGGGSPEDASQSRSSPSATSPSQELIAGLLAVRPARLAEHVAGGEIACGVTLAALALYQAGRR